MEGDFGMANNGAAGHRRHSDFISASTPVSSRDAASQRPGANPHRAPSQQQQQQLDFHQAMSDFARMFPSMDAEVIEAVLRANDGAVDPTVDQLLTMNVGNDVDMIQLGDVVVVALESKRKNPLSDEPNMIRFDEPDGEMATDAESSRRHALTEKLENLSVDQLGAMGGLLLPGSVASSLTDSQPPNPSPPPPPPPKKNAASSLKTDDAGVGAASRGAGHDDPPPKYSPPRAAPLRHSHSHPVSPSQHHHHHHHQQQQETRPPAERSPGPYLDNPPTYRAAVGESPLRHPSHHHHHRLGVGRDDDDEARLSRNSSSPPNRSSGVGGGFDRSMSLGAGSDRHRKLAEDGAEAAMLRMVAPTGRDEIFGVSPSSPHSLPRPPPEVIQHHMRVLGGGRRGGGSDVAGTPVEHAHRRRGRASTNATTTRPFKNWNPPLLGKLPADFLRLVPPATPSSSSSSPRFAFPSSSSSSADAFRSSHSSSFHHHHRHHPSPPTLSSASLDLPGHRRPYPAPMPGLTGLPSYSAAAAVDPSEAAAASNHHHHETLQQHHLHLDDRRSSHRGAASPSGVETDGDAGFSSSRFHQASNRHFRLTHNNAVGGSGAFPTLQSSTRHHGVPTRAGRLTLSSGGAFSSGGSEKSVLRTPRSGGRFHSLHSHHRRRTEETAPSGDANAALTLPSLSQQMANNEQRRLATDPELDPQTARFLEDERLAIFLQNEEFLGELRRNDEFMEALRYDQDFLRDCERDSPTMQGPCGPQGEPPLPPGIPLPKDEEAEFRKQLKHMGKFSRKKFAQLAKVFHFRSKKSSSSSKRLISAGSMGPSTANLLEVDDDDDDDDSILEGGETSSPRRRRLEGVEESSDEEEVDRRRNGGGGGDDEEEEEDTLSSDDDDRRLRDGGVPPGLRGMVINNLDDGLPG